MSKIPYKTFLIAALVSPIVVAESGEHGVVEDSSMSVLLRNAYFSRDYKNGVRDRGEWGQAVITNFSSGFTTGTIGFGVDAFGLYALRLDGGKGKSGQGGIDFFKQNADGVAKHDVSRGGVALKLKLSNTTLKIGDQMPTYPVLTSSDTRLLPESYNGVSIHSAEISGLDLNAAHFTAEARKSAESKDGGRLNNIDIIGGSYWLTESLQASAYHSHVADFLDKMYGSVSYMLKLNTLSSLNIDLRGYKTTLTDDYATQLNSGRDGTIWSLASTYKTGPHTFIAAYQKNNGDFGYPYGGYQSLKRPGDGGSTIYIANSFWSDFNGRNEASYQLGYGHDFTSLGLPGLTYRFAYVEGSEITTPTGDGHEREIFNQFKYVVQRGHLKDLNFRIRSSILHVSENAEKYNISGKEARVVIEYPFSIF